VTSVDIDNNQRTDYSIPQTKREQIYRSVMMDQRKNNQDI